MPTRGAQVPKDWGRGRSKCFAETPGRRREPLRGDDPRAGGEEAPPACSPPPSHCHSYLPKNNSGPLGPGGAASVPRAEPGEACRARARREPGAPVSLPSRAARKRRKGTFLLPGAPQAWTQGPHRPRVLGAERRGRPPPLSRALGSDKPPPRPAQPPRFGLLARAGRAGRRRRRRRWAGRRPARVPSGPGPARAGRWRPTWITASAKR